MTNVLILMAADRLGGLGRQVLQNLERVDCNRYRLLLACTQLSTSQPYDFIKEVVRRGIRLHLLNQNSAYDPSPIFNVSKIISKERIDIIETHGYKSCVIGWIISRFNNIKWITVIHGHTTENRKMALYYRIELQLAKQADLIVTVSKEMQIRLIKQGLPANRTIVIHNALDPGQFLEKSTPVTRETFGVTHDEKLIGVIGRLSPEKGQDVLLEALRTLDTVSLQIKVLFIGEGPTEGRLRELSAQYNLEDRVIFTGYQEHIAGYYPLLDAIVLPSRSEGLPNVALEALHFRIPIVATSAGGTPEVIIDGCTGLLVSPDDPIGLAHAIYRILTDYSLRQVITDQGASYLQCEYSPKARIEKIEATYLSLGVCRT